MWGFTSRHIDSRDFGHLSEYLGSGDHVSETWELGKLGVGDCDISYLALSNDELNSQNGQPKPSTPCLSYDSAAPLSLVEELHCLDTGILVPSGKLVMSSMLPCHFSLSRSLSLAQERHWCCGFMNRGCDTGQLAHATAEMAPTALNSLPPGN